MEVEAIKDIKKIQAMKVLLRNRSLRDEAMFVLGINTALRISDLLTLKVSDVINGKGKMLGSVEIQEQKTGKMKQFQLNKSVKDTLSSYLKTRPNCTQDEPLFPSRNGGSPLCRWRARDILHEAGEAVGLDRIGTHSLRKTFGYHAYRKSCGNLGLVQKLLNHATSRDTLQYIGIDKEEMDATYMDLNL
jgi:integrase